MKKNFLKVSITATILTLVSGGLFAKPISKNKSNSVREETVLGDLHRHSVGIGLGQTVLHGDFNDHGENRITADALYSYSASYSFDFLANLHYSKHSFRGEEAILPGIATSIKARFFQFDSFSPYFVGGLGFYRPLVERIVDNKAEKSEGKWTFGTNFGVGVDLKLNSRFAFGVMLQHHNPFDIKQEQGAEVEGSYSKVMLTTMYTF